MRNDSRDRAGFGTITAVGTIAIVTPRGGVMVAAP